MTSSDPDSGASASVSGLALAAGVVGVLALLVVALAGTFVLGLGPFASGPGDGPPPVPTATGDGSPNDPDHVRPFGFDIDGIERCGTTCRDVTASLTNNGGNPRENVTVTTEIYAGNDSVWEGEQDLGTFAPDETKTRTREIDVGYVGATKIERNDGYVTIITTVDWDGGSATYRERRKVT